METNNLVKPTDKQQTAEPTPVILTCKQEEEMIVCEVCGHANPKYTALCKMCSNYLND